MGGIKKSAGLGGLEYFPTELLGLILDKLTLLPDYIRFGAVCKLWHSIALEQREQRIQNAHKQPPLLLIPQDQSLCSIWESKVWEARFEIPRNGRCCGSSYGWWAIAEHGFSVTLLNPLSGKTIKLPAIFDDLDLEIRKRLQLVPTIRKVILSCDPSTHPDDFIVAAIYDVSPRVAFFRSGEQSWTYPRRSFGPVNDVLFYKRMLYAINRKNQLLAIDCNKNDNAEDDDENFHPDPYFVVERPSLNGYSFKSYIVESSRGELLLVRRLRSRRDDGNLFGMTVKFKVYKLKKVITEEIEKSDFEKIHKLDDDDALFLGDNHSLCISASYFPNCSSNCIYFTDDRFVRDPVDPPMPADIGEFHLEDRIIRNDCWFNGSLGYMSPGSWLSPTLQ